MRQVQAMTVRDPSPRNAPTAYADALDLLRDSERLTQWLTHLVEWPGETILERASIKRIWPGRRGRITFELSLSLTQDGCVTRTLLQGGLGPFGKPIRVHRQARITKGSLMGLRMETERPAFWFCTPDCDPRLAFAAWMLRSGDRGSNTVPAAGHLLLETLAPGKTVRALDRALLSYRAGKRCVMAVRSKATPEASGLIVKVFRRPPDKQRLTWLGSLSEQLSSRSGGAIETPAISASFPDENLIVFKEVSSAAKRMGCSQEDVTAAADVLVILHDGNLMPLDRHHTPRDEWDTVYRWVGLLDQLNPGAQPQLRAVVDRLFAQVNRMDAKPTTVIHRDYYNAQLIRDPQLRVGDTACVWLLDLDTACGGHGEVDIATYVAHLLLDELSGGHTREQAIERAGRFIDRYRQRGGQLDVDRLRFYLSCALARLGAVHQPRGVSREVIDFLWKQAGSLLDRADDPILGGCRRNAGAGGTTSKSHQRRAGA